MWLVLTLIAAFMWGIGPVLAKKGLSHTTPLFNNLIAGFVTLAITVPFAIFMGGKIFIKKSACIHGTLFVHSSRMVALTLKIGIQDNGQVCVAIALRAVLQVQDYGNRSVK